MSNEMTVSSTLKPFFKKPRHKCPFYGFYFWLSGGLFMDQEGNQCALITHSYSPCCREIQGQSPDWDECRFNGTENEDAINFIMECGIFPKEFEPEGKPSWKGMPFKEWMEYVMGEDVERP